MSELIFALLLAVASGQCFIVDENTPVENCTSNWYTDGDCVNITVPATFACPNYPFRMIVLSDNVTFENTSVSEVTIDKNGTFSLYNSTVELLGIFPTVLSVHFQFDNLAQIENFSSYKILIFIRYQRREWIDDSRTIEIAGTRNQHVQGVVAS